MWEVYFSLVEIRNFHIMLYMLQVPRSKHLCPSIVVNPITAGLLLLGMVMHTNSNHPTQPVGVQPGFHVILQKDPETMAHCGVI